MIDRAAIIEECEKACEGVIFDCRTPEAENIRYGAQQCLDRIRALAAVPPAPPSIPEREKVLGSLCYVRDWIERGDRNNSSLACDELEAAIAALEGK